MIRFEMDVQAADLMHRTIEGVIVPFGETGRIAGKQYRFASGTVRLARQRTPLLLDHDRGRPVGVLSDLRDEPTGVYATFKVDATPLGDEALTQAASGSRGSFSIGAELDHDPVAGVDGVVDVRGAAVHEVSLLALGAFPGAGVTRVAAETDEPEPEPEPDDDPDPDEPVAVHPNQEALPMEAEIDTPRVILAERTPAPRDLTAGEYALLSVKAVQGDPEARRVLEAALTETLTTDLAGVLPPAYESTVLGSKIVDRVLWEVFHGKPLPAVGIAVEKPKWTTLPQGAWAANLDADATTSKAVIGLQPANIERWDWATAISYVAAQRSSPDAIDTLYGEAVTNFYAAVEAKIATKLETAAIDAADTIGAGIGAYYTSTSRSPEVIVVSPDVWGELADARMLETNLGTGPSVTGVSGLHASFAGLTIVASGALPAATRILASRRALDVRTSDPVRLTANAIGALNVELGVVGEALFDIDYPNEIMALTVAAPGAEAEASRRRSSK